jgi:hypothetical protein
MQFYYSYFSNNPSIRNFANPINILLYQQEIQKELFNHSQDILEVYRYGHNLKM